MNGVTNNKQTLLYEKESYKLRGLFMKIYNELGPGLKESIYGNAFEELLKQEKIPYKREPNMPVEFEGKKVGDYRPDFLVYGKIIIEFKSVPQIPRIHIQRVYQYLRSSQYKLGFIVNFGTPKLQIIRRIYDLNQSVKSVAIRKNPCGEAGQSLLEVLIALAVFIVGVATIGLLALDANVASRQGVERTQATLLAKEGLEAARSIRDADFDNLTAGSHGLALSGNKWIFSGTSDTQNQFTRAIAITNIDVDTKKIDSVVTWQFTQTRQNSVTLTDYLTDWNQTQGQAGGLSVDISNAVLAKANKQLEGITIQNTGTGAITIDKMTIWWDNSQLIEEIKIDNIKVWAWKGGIGTPGGRQPSGTELNINDFVLAQGSGVKNINNISFNGSMSGATFIIKFIMSDGSTKYVLVEPGAEPPPGNQADSLVVDTTNAAIDGSDNKKVIGITISNSGGTDIIVDRITVSWTGAPGGTKINEIVINGNSVWSGNGNSGSELDITDFTLISGAGSYPINSLTFSKNMTGITLSIIFTMADGSTKSTGSFSP